ncbi:alpha/beta hydrolase [Corynebacterium sp. Q4381]|uniref:alpha/beta hydrolase n=1 Tax=Corynebacterium sp. Marseille-Q4381 TaxID=3121597 RepID=UPI002FE5E189
MIYHPSLYPHELRAAAASWRMAALAADAHASAARAAAAALKATGFAGSAAGAAYARLEAQAEDFARAAARARQAADLLEFAAGQQQLLDEVARRAALMAADASHRALIIRLNLMSKQLDMLIADQLGAGGDDPVDRLVAHPEEDLEALHARYVGTLPAASASAIAQAGGTVLEAGPGSTTVMVGDSVDPDRIITLVNGVTTGKPDALPREIERAKFIADYTGAAVVVWQGYAPPPTVAKGFSGRAASEGAGHLAMFQLALDERFPHAEKSVVSHSYGTVVASRAAYEHGLVADDLWLLGSPGVDGNSVDDLQLTGRPGAAPRVYAVDASRDIIKTLRNDDASLHGMHSPSDPGYGAIIIDGVEGTHTEYFASPVLLNALTCPPDPAAQNSLPSAVANLKI